MSADLETAIAQAWENRASVTPASREVREPVEAALELLDSGQARVAEPDGEGGWKVPRARRPMTRSRASSKAGARTASATRASAWSPAPWRGAAATSPGAWC